MKKDTFHQPILLAHTSPTKGVNQTKDKCVLCDNTVYRSETAYSPDGSSLLKQADVEDKFKKKPKVVCNECAEGMANAVITNMGLPRL